MSQAQYYFHVDEEAQAYRITGLASRMCYEKGLHRQEILFQTFPDEKERFWVTRLFWSIYILDRRWSFGTGMPFAIQDNDIDPTLPEPVRVLALALSDPAKTVLRTKKLLTYQRWSLMER